MTPKAKRNKRMRERRKGIDHKIYQSDRYKRQRLNTPWMFPYKSAKSRCEYEKKESYNRYGGIGIQFLLSMEEVKLLWTRDQASQLQRPSIDRINSKGHYTYNNCRFIELGLNSSRRTKVGYLGPL